MTDNRDQTDVEKILIFIFLIIYLLFIYLFIFCGQLVEFYLVSLSNPLVKT